MTILHFEVRHIKRQLKHYPESYYCKCPNPQWNQYCNGLYVHTRRWQTECVECMKKHHTIEHHPMLVKLTRRDYDILVI